MRATMSLVQAWLAGIGVFIAMTAAFFVALVFAIAGPPTSEEMSGVRAASASAMRGLSGALKRAGEDLCQAIPGTVGADEFCPAGDAVQTVEAHPPAAAPPAASAAPETPDAPPHAIVVSEVSAPAPADPNLLGAPDGAVSPLPAPVVARAVQPRRAGASLRHARRETAHARPAHMRLAPVHVAPPTRRPLPRAQMAPAETLPAPGTATLVHVEPAPVRVIAPPPAALRQDEAPPVVDKEKAPGDL